MSRGPVKAESKPEIKPDVKREPARRDEAKRDERGIATVRVQAERLDELMDRVGELVIAQARLTQLAAAGSDLSIKMIAEEIERLAASLRDTTMGARMVPIGSLFGRFRRLVHDLSRDLAKPVEFVTTGEDTELDKTMIECLADPLVHLIRNAIDHGIEDTAERTAAGKTEQGRIELYAVHSGAQVLVTVKDNGGGLNTARIRSKAEEQGLIASGAALSDHEVHQLLFHPGFSTAQTISALSGRGVGMDVVKRTIENMRGSIDLSTMPGQGTTVTLRLPLTLAIIEGLLIRVGEGRYIIPLPAVEECVELTADDERSRGRNFLNMRGNLVPFLRLREILAVPGAPTEHQKTIIISTGESRVGLVADQIIGNHQTVIKSLSKLHSDVTIFSGATILGDGTAALILDVDAARRHGAVAYRKTPYQRGSVMSEGLGPAGEPGVTLMQVVMIGLGEEKFALDAAMVREIIDPVPVTRVASARSFVPSVINVRGNVIPLADLRIRFGMPQTDQSTDTRIVVLELEIDNEPVLVGVTADKVYEVTEISQTDVQQTPRVGMHWKPEFIRLITKWREEFVIVPNMERILNLN